MVIVGATTVRTEGYGPPRTPGLRIAVVSRTGDFDFGQPLWTSGRAVLVLPERAPEVPVPSVRAGVDDVDLAAALAQLDANTVQAEGGATLNGALAAADLIDESLLAEVDKHFRKLHRKQGNTAACATINRFHTST